MSKLTQKYEQLAAVLGLQLDGARNILYGQRNGFDIMVYAADARYPYMLTVSLGAKASMGALDKADCKQFVKSEKGATLLRQEGNLIKMTLKNTKNQEKLRDYFIQSFNSLTAFLRSKGFEPCCQHCGQQIETTGYEVGGSYMHLCPDCAGRLRQDITLATQQKLQKSENIAGGVVGALLGSVIGILCIIFFSQLGRIAVVSGIVMAVCTLKGYELLGGRLTKKGIVISVIMMLLMTYVGDRMDWAILIMREWDTDFITGFQYVPVLLAEDVIDQGSYWYNIIMLYIFTIAGAIPTIHAVLKDKKKEGQFAQIGSAKQNLTI